MMIEINRDTIAKGKTRHACAYDLKENLPGFSSHPSFVPSGGYPE